MQIQILNATGDLLEMLVAIAEGARDPHSRYAGMTTSWGQAGPMLERNGISLAYAAATKTWTATLASFKANDPAPLVAAARVRCMQFYNGPTVDLETVVPR